IIFSNPYNEEIYLYLLSKYGDENLGIRNICDFLDIEIEDKKQLLMRNFFEYICKNNKERTKESIKEFEIYAQKMGFTEIDSYGEEFNKILRQHDVNIRTVDGILFGTREDAQAAETEYCQITLISSKTDFKSEESIRSAVEEIKIYST